MNIAWAPRWLYRDGGHLLTRYRGFEKFKRLFAVIHSNAGFVRGLLVLTFRCGKLAGKPLRVAPFRGADVIGIEKVTVEGG